MSTLSAVANPLERIAHDPLWLRRWSVAEYHRMIESGILGPDDRVELLEGWVVKKMPQKPPHASSVGRVNRWLGRILPSTWSLRCQVPITLSESEPEPDITLARGEEGTYDSRHSRPRDIGVLMEVGDSTVMDDRRYKGVLYALEKIHEFWLINVVERTVEVYTKPRGGKYQKRVVYSEKETVPLNLDGETIAEIPVRESLPRS
jgi:hypothetical protein